MGAMNVPTEIAAALASRGMVPTGSIGTSGGWVARDAGGGLVELLGAGPVPDEGAAARVVALRHEHLVPVREVVPLPGGRCALLVEHVPAVTLAGIRRARVPLTEAEAATVAIPLAEALDALHAAGAVQGPVGAADVLLTCEGKPVLAASATWLAAGLEPGEDVAGLLTTVLGAMAPPDVAGWDEDWPARLRPALEGLLRDGRRDGASVVAACLDAVRPEPLRLPDAGALAGAHVLDPVGGDRGAEPTGSRVPGRLPRPAAGRPPSRGVPRRTCGEASGAMGDAPGAGRRAARRRRRRRGRLGGAALVLAALAVLVVLLVRPAAEVRAEPPAEPSAAALAAVADPVHDPSQPQAAAAALTRLRAAVLVAGDPAGLDEVSVAGSPAREADEAVLAALGADRLVGLSADVRDARAEQVAGDRAWVAVTAAMSPYERVAAEGDVTKVAGTTPREVVLLLEWTDDGWRVASVSEER
jgi:hypothetical protein